MDRTIRPSAATIQLLCAFGQTVKSVLKCALKFESQKDLNAKDQEPRLVQGRLQFSVDLFRHFVRNDVVTEL